MGNVQIFGIKKSAASRAAERFFKERRVAVQYVDLTKKPMSPGEIKRFVDRFGLVQLVDTEGAAYVDGGLKYLKVSDAELLERIAGDARLLRLPLVRAGNQLSIGQDEAGWKAMIGAAGS
jgi:arsenate reductase